MQIIFTKPWLLLLFTHNLTIQILKIAHLYLSLISGIFSINIKKPKTYTDTIIYKPQIHKYRITLYKHVCDKKKTFNTEDTPVKLKKKK